MSEYPKLVKTENGKVRVMNAEHEAKLFPSKEEKKEDKKEEKKSAAAGWGS